MNAQRWRTRHAIFATAVFFIAVVLASRTTFLWYEYQQALDRGVATTRDMAHVLDEYASRTFDVNDLVADDLVGYVAAQGGISALAGDPEAPAFLRTLSARTANNDYLLVVDARGTPVAGSAWDAPPAINLADRRWFRMHADEGRDSYVGEAINSRLTHEIPFTYSRAIRGADGRLDGVVQVAVRPAFIQDITLGSDIGRGLVLSLVGDDGRLIARTGLHATQVGTATANLLPPDVLGEPQGTLVYEDRSGGGRVLVSWRRLGKWPVVVAAALPMTEVLAPFRSSLSWSVLLLALIVAVTAGLSVTGLRLAAREERAREEAEAATRRLSAAVAERDLLMRDIHHRVKNNLQVTISLLMVQANQFSDPAVRAAFADTQERLQSIGLLHEALYQTDKISRVDLADYIRRLGGALSEAHGAADRGIALDLDLEPLEIDPTKAVPYALILSEVVSNAFKHAFADGHAGRIGIALRKQGDGLFLRIRDDGPGLPAGERRSGAVGMTLIEALVQQVGGRHRICNDGGAVFELTVDRV